MKAETSQQLLDWIPPPHQDIIGNGILSTGGRMIIFGRWGSWKSMLAMHTGFCLSQGRRWLGYEVNKAATLIAQVEIPRYRLRERVMKYVGGNGVRPDNLWFLTEPYMRLDDLRTYDTFAGLIALHKPRVIVIDPLYKSIAANISDNHAVLQCLDLLDKLVAGSDTAIIIISHTIKLPRLQEGEEYDWGQLLVGGSYIMNWVDTAVVMQPTGDTTQDLHFLKARNATDAPTTLHLRVDRSSLHFKLEE